MKEKIRSNASLPRSFKGFRDLCSIDLQTVSMVPGRVQVKVGVMVGGREGRW